MNRVHRIKRRKRLFRMHVTRQAQKPRSDHSLVALCETLLLWRDLERLDFGTSERQMRRRVLRSFCFLLMERTSPEDIGLIEYLLDRQSHSATPVWGMLRVRMIDLAVDYPEYVRPRIEDRSMHRPAESLLDERESLVQSLVSDYPLGRLLDRRLADNPALAAA